MSTGEQSEMGNDRPAAERLLELAVFAPIGLALTLHDRLPPELRRRRQALENRVQLARMIGQFAVQQGRAEIARQAAKRATSPSPITEAPDIGASSERPTSAESDTPSEVHDAGNRATTGTGVVDTDVPAPDELPIAGYESLAAMHVVQRLGGLHAEELETVRRFEVAHRGRRTVLAKIEQIQAIQ